jgi:hypothetical protein
MQTEQEQEGNALGAFIVGIALGATVMFFAYGYYWRVQQMSFRTAQECAHAAQACNAAAQIAKDCP